MTVRLLLFASYRDLAGASSLEVELPEGASAASLIRRIRSRDGLDRLPEEPAIAINRRHAALSTTLRQGDEVALLPPVAGG